MKHNLNISVKTEYLRLTFGSTVNCQIFILYVSRDILKHTLLFILHNILFFSFCVCGLNSNKMERNRYCKIQHCEYEAGTKDQNISFFR